MTTVRAHTRQTKHGSTHVRRHARRTPFAKSNIDELTVAAGALVLSLVTMIVWGLSAIMSVTAAVLSMVATVALAVLGFKVRKRRRARAAHKRSQPRNRPLPAKTSRRRRYRKAIHPIRTVKAAARKRIKKARRKLYRRLEKRWAARSKVS